MKTVFVKSETGTKQRTKIRLHKISQRKILSTDLIDTFSQGSAFRVQFSWGNARQQFALFDQGADHQRDLIITTVS